MTTYVVSCRDCDWERAFPERDHAEHAKRAHERWVNHSVALDVED
ncbi:MAG: hypothetical protein ABEJ04_04855 [Halobacteriaceae archaeon]